MLRNVPQNGPTLAASGRRVPAREIHELWFATRRTNWSTLAIVPAGPAPSLRRTASAMCEVGGLSGGRHVRLVTIEPHDLNRIAELVSELEELRTIREGAQRAGPSPQLCTVLALDAIDENPLLLPLALAADAVLLYLEVGSTQLDRAQHTIDVIGRDRFIGSVLVRQDGTLKTTP